MVEGAKPSRKKIPLTSNRFVSFSVQVLRALRIPALLWLLVKRLGAFAKFVWHALPKQLRWPFRRLTAMVAAAYAWLLEFLSWVLRSVLQAPTAHPFYAILVLIFLYFFSAIFNPFNTEDTADQNTAQILNALTSPLYGQRNGRIAQREITVILIQTESLKTFGSPFWPPTYQAQSALLERISQFRPEAIFLDFYYENPQPLPGTFVTFDAEANPDIRRLAALREQVEGVDPESFAHVTTFAETLASIRSRRNLPAAGEGLDPITMRPLPILLGPVGDNPRLAPLREFIRDPYSGDSASVGVQVSEETSIYYPVRDDDGRKQAAFALYEILCQRTASAEVARYCRNYDKWSLNPQPLNVEWGFGTPNPFYRRGEDGERSVLMELEERDAELGLPERCRADHFWGRIGKVFHILFSNFIRGTAQQDYSGGGRCTYHTIIPAHYLFGSFFSQEQLEALIQDRIVMVGADISYLRDDFDTPLYGRLPGVMVHAMALDNLIEHGPKAQRAPVSVIGSSDLADILVGLMLVAACLMLYHVHQTAPEVRNEKEWRNVMVRYTGVIMAFVMAGLLVVYFFHWPPLNVFEIVVVLFGCFSVLELLNPLTPTKESGPFEEISHETTV